MLPFGVRIKWGGEDSVGRELAPGICCTKRRDPKRKIEAVGGGCHRVDVAFLRPAVLPQEGANAAGAHTHDDD